MKTKKKDSEKYLWKLGNFDASGQEVDQEFMEISWWVFRGAQSTLLRKEPDYLKLYLPPQGEAVIQAYGFIKGAVKQAGDVNIL